MDFLIPMPNPENRIHASLFETHECRSCLALNPVLRARITRLSDTGIVRRSHYLGGRYENIYVDKDSLPEIATILDSAIMQAAIILGQPRASLRIGWWLNVMQPGDVTYAHTHDDGDELLSGVYYIDAPPDSGRLVLCDAGRREEIEARAGLFVFFAPAIMHEVTRNESGRQRLSVGFNIGLPGTTGGFRN
jgi:hypothetical protein